ncbi:Uncharacterized protein Fot_13116 [Forsythia ovata]|uniref:LYR motif containing domain-containing protein n=1 Tax=Forsythia ovata TaxID=205694 RepID=A0ABD1W2K0_9LAMI
MNSDRWSLEIYEFIGDFWRNFSSRLAAQHRKCCYMDIIIMSIETLVQQVLDECKVGIRTGVRDGFVKILLGECSLLYTGHNSMVGSQNLHENIFCLLMDLACPQIVLVYIAHPKLKPKILSEFLNLKIEPLHLSRPTSRLPIFKASESSGSAGDSKRSLAKQGKGEMTKGLVWATSEDLARNRGRVISLYRQILRSLNSPDLPLNLATRLAKKAKVRAIFMLGLEERSLHNIEDLIHAANYSLSLLKKGEIPKHIQ